MLERRDKWWWIKILGQTAISQTRYNGVASTCSPDGTRCGTHTHTHILPRTHTHIHIHTRTHTLPRARTRAHTQTQIFSPSSFIHTHTHAHTHTLIQSHTHPVSCCCTVPGIASDLPLLPLHRCEETLGARAEAADLPTASA